MKTARGRGDRNRLLVSKAVQKDILRMERKTKVEGNRRERERKKKKKTCIKYWVG